MIPIETPQPVGGANPDIPGQSIHNVVSVGFCNDAGGRVEKAAEKTREAGKEAQKEANKPGA